MTVRVERTFDLAAPREAVWAFIADPEKRSRPISVVSEWEQRDGNHARWHVKLPIPLINQTIAVDTEETHREENEYVRFTGRSRAMRVVGEHELRDGPDGTLLVNRFIVEGRLPGVERFFKRNLDAELDNLEAAIREELGL